MLQALVEEMNLYKESPETASNWLNIKLELGETRVDTYLIEKLVVDGTDITSKIQRPTWSGNPSTSDSVEIHVYGRSWTGSYRQWTVYFSPQTHLKSGNLTSGVFVLEDDVRNSKAVLLKSSRKSPAAMATILVS